MSKITRILTLFFEKYIMIWMSVNGKCVIVYLYLID